MATHGYARASTGKQYLSPLVQVEAIERYCHQQNLGKPSILQDQETSSKIPFAERKAGKAILASLRKGDHLVLYKLDRAYRSMREVVNAIHDFQAQGIHLHCLNIQGVGALDLTTTMGKFVIVLYGMFAEMEREMICERTKDGLNCLKRTGAALGGNAPYGFKKVHRKDHRGTYFKRIDKEGRETPRWFLAPCPEERKAGEFIVRAVDHTGLQLKEIAVKLNELGFTKKDGGTWKQHAVFRVYHSEKALQLQEMLDAKHRGDFDPSTTTSDLGSDLLLGRPELVQSAV